MRALTIFLIMLSLFPSTVSRQPPSESVDSTPANWQIYQQPQLGYTFAYPPDAHITVSQDRSSAYPLIRVAFSLADAFSYQGTVVVVLPKQPTQEDLLLSAGLSSQAQQQMFQINGATWLHVQDGDEVAWLLPTAEVTYMLAAVHDPILAPDERTLRLTQQIAESFTAPLQSPPAVAWQPFFKEDAAPALQTTDSSFLYPVGQRDGDVYAPHYILSDTGTLIEDTRYAIKNPALDPHMTCFGLIWTQIYHAGEDLYRANGTSTYGSAVTAVADGVVYDYNPRWYYPGAGVVIQHTDPATGSPVYAVFMHIENIQVVTGQAVKRGQLIGTIMYQTQAGLDDSHLHFEMRLFPDATKIYGNIPSCNLSDAPGRGYTYPALPDNFPSYESGYRDPELYFKKAVVLTPRTFFPQIAKPADCGVLFLPNGDFESGSSDWISSRADLIALQDAAGLPAQPYQGKRLAWFLGQDGRSDTLWQPITVLPGMSGNLQITYWVYVTSQETNNDADYLKLRLRDSAGNLIRQLDRVDSYRTPRDQWVQRTVLAGDLSAYIQQSIRLSFESDSNTANMTNILLDAVTLTAVCGN